MAFEHIAPQGKRLGKELPKASSGRPPTPGVLDKLKPLRSTPGVFDTLCDPVTTPAGAAGLRADVRGLRAMIAEQARTTGDLSLIGYEIRTRTIGEQGTVIVGRFQMPEELKKTPKKK